MSKRLETLDGRLFRPLRAEAAAALGGATAAAAAGHATFIAWDIIDGQLMPAYTWDPDIAAE